MTQARGKPNSVLFSACASHQSLPVIGVGRGAFSLVELLIVIVLMSILAKLAITSATPTLYDQLHSMAGVVASELAYGRSLAVANNSRYRFDIDTAGNRLVLRHSGSDASLGALPSHPFRSPADPPDQQILSLAELPRMGMPVSVLGAESIGTVSQSITSIEFGPFGETLRPDDSVIWLTAGVGSQRRFISVRVNAVTGLTSVGVYSGVPPSGIVIPAT